MAHLHPVRGRRPGCLPPPDRVLGAEIVTGFGCIIGRKRVE